MTRMSLPLIEMVEHQRSQFGYSCYMEVIMLATWTIWIHRNNIIFNVGQVSFVRWKREFKEVLILCDHRAKPSLQLDLTAWLSSL